MSREINRPVFDGCASRLLPKKVVTLPVCRRSDGAENETATAVGADVAQYLINACGKERTFIGADACLTRIGWQRFVAVLAGRPEFQHGGFFYVERRVQKSAVAQSTVKSEAYLLLRRRRAKGKNGQCSMSNFEWGTGYEVFRN